MVLLIPLIIMMIIMMMILLSSLYCTEWNLLCVSNCFSISEEKFCDRTMTSHSLSLVVSVFRFLLFIETDFEIHKTIESFCSSICFFQCFAPLQFVFSTLFFSGCLPTSPKPRSVSEVALFFYDCFSIVFVDVYIYKYISIY